jgi:GH15 family glucan-1,4-alpha-glucosidase
MARSLTLGNGSLLVGYDEWGEVKDLYFPHVGLENHVGFEKVHRVGVRVGNEFHWLNDGTWQVTVDLEPSTLIGVVRATCERLGISLTFTDVVYNERPIFIRKCTIRNLSPDTRDVEIFFGHEFEIGGSKLAHTAYYDPRIPALIHYRGPRVFLATASKQGVPFSEFTTGVRGIDNKEGSYRDAEDGVLSKNPIEHGPADSVLSLSARIASGDSEAIHYVLTIGTSIEEAKEHHAYVKRKTEEHLIITTRDFWKAWLSRRSFNFYGLGERVERLFQISLLTIRIHSDSDGAIIASSDTSIAQGGKDTYAYMWPRDGANTAIALYRSGSYEVAKRFFRFAADVITKDGYFLHKYAPDKSLGSSWHPWVREGTPSLPIQEDETAIVIFALEQYYALSKDLEFIEDIYNPLIRRAADFMLSYRDPKTGLPSGSYDLWERKFGTHTFTASAVSGALRAAAKFATLLGKTEEAMRYSKASQEIGDAILHYSYDAGSGCFFNSLSLEENTSWITDRTVDISSAYGVFRFGVAEATDERVRNAFARTEKVLTLNTLVGGMSRFEGDEYWRIREDIPGNPWFIATLWDAQYHIALAKNDEDLDHARHALRWVVEHASPSGMLSEQLHPDSGAQLSVTPLTWSHAEFVITVLDYLDKLQELGICEKCNPVKE